MKKIKLLIYSPLLLLLLLFPFVFPGPEPEQHEMVANTTTVASEDTLHTAPEAQPAPAVVARQKPAKPVPQAQGAVSRREIVSYALTLLGKPYSYGGITPRGFDCSGFTTHVFQTFGVDISRSSNLQAKNGIAVSKNEAKPGDLVIFTGTNPEVRNPGHVGIVISAPGDTISFVHSSSNGGVKVSKVQGTRYNTRFLQIRRIL
ncbi:C40 family peptidase [Botryobacter ruber]|uniref:C40 family peptidase n=1 Tax=Botryobacter ruber TaxID=2171629 RepID=UPI000E0A9087|nr:C40 family peptidase [Botryobacter ruber]